jgi:hypothetical protein
VSAVVQFPRPSFPNPVDEVSARLVGFGVVLQGGLFVITGSTVVAAAVTFGFAARVLYGPRFSPLGRLVTQGIRPRLTSIAPKFVAGPPKRFAQGIGLAFSSSALVASLAGTTTVARAIVAALMVAASLEAFVGVCLGCVAFRQLMRVGAIPASVCESCNDISGHLAALAASRSTQQPATAA